MMRIGEVILRSFLNHVTSYSYNSHGLVTLITYADSTTTQYGYNSRDDLVSVTDALGKETDYSYDNLDRLISKTDPDPDGSGPLGRPVTYYQYDAVGNLTSVVDPNLNITSYLYDSHNRLQYVIQPDPDGSGPASSPITQYGYDLAGNLTSVTDPMGRLTTYSYDALNRLQIETDPDPDGSGPLTAAQTTYAYNPEGWITSTTDALGHSTHYTYDAVGRVLTATDPNNAATTYSYDNNGNVYSLTDPKGNMTSWGYDELNRQTFQLVQPTFASAHTQYDAAGNVTQMTDADGRVTQFQYDQLNRETAELWKDGANTIRTIAFSYDADGRMTGATDRDGSNSPASADYSFTLDALGRQTAVTSTLAGMTPTVTFSQQFDQNSNRTQLAASIGSTSDFVTNYALDPLNRVKQIVQQGVTGGNTVSTKRVDLFYNAASQFVEIDRYNNTTASSANLVASSTYGYDNAGRVTSLAYVNGSTTFAGFGFSYDAANRLSTYTNTANTNENVSYSYDNDGQLTGADYTGFSDQSYTYDNNGNRTSITTGTLTRNYTIGDDNRLTSDGVYNYTYDAEGNRTSRTNATDGTYVEYTWDYRNRLQQVTFKSSATGSVTRTITYRYDAFDRMVYESSVLAALPNAGAYQWLVYDPQSAGQVTLSLSSDGTVLHRLLWEPGVDQALADESGSGDTYWNLTDQQNTVRDLVEYFGTYDVEDQQHNLFNAFGQLRSQTGNADDFGTGYTGADTDAWTGLEYHWHRWYDPQDGRWLTKDPAGFAAGDANLYRYVGNSPTNATDSSGLEGEATAASPYSSGFGYGYRDQFGYHRSFCMSCHDISDPGANYKMSLARNTLNDSWEFFVFDQAAKQAVFAAMGMGAGWAVELGGMEATEASTLAGSIRGVNPTGSNLNCVNCAIATEYTLRGSPATALPSTGPLAVSRITNEFGGRFSPVSGPMQIGSILSESGEGASGIVFGQGTNSNHVWNVVNQGGIIRFLDGQTGGLGIWNFERYKNFQMLLTNPGR
jgi:RHS repeat-associated protein